jgi:hypothetical protein
MNKTINMENQDQQQENEEINNPEQFQVGRTNPLQQHQEGQQEQDGEVEYTAEEMEYADGKGTELAEAFEDDDVANEDSGQEDQDPQE